MSSDTAKARRTTEDRIPDLDGLRGIAILMVVVCHYVFGPSLEPRFPDSWRVTLFHLFASGVDLFFVLSGFLIGGILLANRNAEFYFQAFYGRRALRIFPVYYGFLIGTGVLGYFLHAAHKPTPVYDGQTPYWMFFLFLQNFAIRWYDDWGWIAVSMTWSLALEEQFYLTLPAALRFASTRLVILVSAAIVAAAPVLRFLVTDQPGTLGTLLHAALRVDGLVAGFLCACWVRSSGAIPTKTLVSLVVILAALTFASQVPRSPIPYLRETLFLSLYSCVLLLAVRGAIPGLRSSVLVFFGTISYTLYMVHQTCLLLTHSLILHRVPSASGPMAFLATAAAFALSLLICWISWRHLEKPLVTWARTRFQYSRPR